MTATWDRVILHVDMDAFFAAVEVLDRPELVGRPVIVGGTGDRGVVASCSYEARAFGVRSAMPSVQARRLCPGAVFLEGRHRRYAEVSAVLHAVLHRFTPLVEGIGLDEAFLDMTGGQLLHDNPLEMAIALRRAVRAEVNLACSVGVGRSKMVAKLASRAAKPVSGGGGGHPGPGEGAGVVVVPREEEGAFLRGHRVESLWGVGRVTGARLRSLGIVSVGQLADIPDDVLVRHLGRSHGLRLAGLARGDDPDPVVPDRPTRSIGHEQTFAQDVCDPLELGRHVTRLSDAVARRARAARLAGRTVTVKVRRPDLSTVSRAHTLSAPLDAGAAIGAVAGALMESVEVEGGVRLLGVSLSGLVPSGAAEQLTLVIDPGEAPTADLGAPGRSRTLDPVCESPRSGASGGLDGQVARIQGAWQEIEAAVDAIRERFGSGAVASGALRQQDLDHRAPGGARWGPPAPEPPGEPGERSL